MDQVLRSALNQVAQAVLIVDPAMWQVCFANPAARNRLGLANPSADSTSLLADLLAASSLAAFERAAQSLRDGGRGDETLDLELADESRGGAWKLRAIEQEDRWWLLAVANVELASPGVVGGALDPACIDELTGLPNRRALRQRFANCCGAAAAPLVPPHSAVFFVDIDDFKQVNDADGHVTGDRVLTSLAQRLAGCVRPADFVSRYGGDEFVLVLELHTPAEAAAVAQRIHDAFEQPLEVDGVTHRIPVSIGIALAEAEGSPLDELIAAADRAMYAAKARTASSEGFAFASAAGN